MVLDVNKLLYTAMLGLLTWNIYQTHLTAVQIAVLGEKVSRLEQMINAK